MSVARFVYGVGVLCGALLGFCSPFWFLGFGPLSVGLVWAAYDLVEVASAEPPTAPRRRSL